MIPLCTNAAAGQIIRYSDRATGLDGPGTNPGDNEIFCPSRPVIVSNQSPVKWVPGVSESKERPGCAADH